MVESGATATTDAVTVILHEPGVVAADQRGAVGDDLDMFQREFGVIAGRREDVVPGVRGRTPAAYGPDGLHYYNANMLPLENGKVVAGVGKGVHGVFGAHYPDMHPLEPGIAAGRDGDAREVLDRTAVAYGHYYKCNIDMLRLDLSTGGGRSEGMGGTVLAANNTSKVYYNSGMLRYEPAAMDADGVLPFAHQAFVGKTTGVPVAAAGCDGDEVAGAFPLVDHVRRALGIVGVTTASLAATGLAAGTATTPAAGFGLFALLLCGLSLVILRVRGA